MLLLLPVGVFLNTYYSLPGSIHLTQHSDYTFKVNSLCSVSADAVTVSENGDSFFSENEDGIAINTSNAGNYSLNVKMFNFIPVKTVDVKVSQEYCVIPSGSAVGIKIYADGLLVVNISKVKTEDGKSVSPAEAAGIKTGDRIIKANGRSLNISEDLSRVVNESEGNVELEVMRDDNLINIAVSPVLDADQNSRKIGIWVRDSTAGVGTLTFYDPQTSSFATLGHGITDVDTGDIIFPKSGTITDCEITYATKSTSGSPGELSGAFGNVCVGNILMNSQLGVYGKIKDASVLNNSGYMPVATRFQIKTGTGYILADVDGEGVKEYSIEIEEVSKRDGIDNKGLVIRITDSKLLEKTGGIVQGMSGAPIIQNGMLVGAVTHVFVNDPTRGYGIFAENMLDVVLKLQ